MSSSDNDFSEHDITPELCEPCSMSFLQHSLEDSLKSTISATSVLSMQGEKATCIRSAVVNWIFRVQAEIGFTKEIAYDAYFIFDKLLSKLKIDQSNAHLYATASMWISAKIEECNFKDISLFQAISQQMFSLEQMVEAESIIVNAMNFNLNFSTCYLFVRALANDLNLDESVTKMCEFYMDVAMNIFQFIETPSFLIAAASIILGIESMKVPYQINEVLKLINWNDQSMLQNVINELLIFSIKLAKRKSSDVFKYYAANDSDKLIKAVDNASKAFNMD